ncbi:MAG TPA: histone deacetylase family protein [Rhodopila sp.]
MTTLLYTHALCLGHDTGPGHPECPERLRAVWQALDAAEFAPLIRREAPRASPSQILRAHSEDYLLRVVNALPALGDRVHLDPDTVLSHGSWEGQLRCIGATLAAIDAVAAKQGDNAFCAVRPCGHHAEADRAMGFCIFNFAAIGALYARDQAGFGKVALVDFDVHHGNGSQHILWHQPGMFYASTHEANHYPGTGSADETGEQAEVVNVPLPAGSGSAGFRRAYDDIIIPALSAFQPDIILISAGFDAHEADPLADLMLTTQDFGWVTRKLMNVADACCDGRVISFLEAGYDLRPLSESTAEHVRTLMRR